jgi:hypothetical protein
MGYPPSQGYPNKQRTYTIHPRGYPNGLVLKDMYLAKKQNGAKAASAVAPITIVFKYAMNWAGNQGSKCVFPQWPVRQYIAFWFPDFYQL